MNDQAAPHKSDTYTVAKELELMPEIHRLPVIPELLKAAGFPVDTPPETLLLAQVIFSGASYGNQWKVSAFVVGGETLGEIWCSRGVGRDEVVKVVDTWVRESDHIVFVPGRVIELPVQEADKPYFFKGIALIRGDRL